ncbi:MAG: hypothetical protein WBF55_14655 [Syntrophobacteria bacterium]
MAVLPGVLGCRPLRRTVHVRLGTNTLRLPGGTPIFVVSRQQFMKYPGQKRDTETRGRQSVTPRRIKLCGWLLLVSCFPHLATHCAHRMVDIVFFESVHPAIVKVNVAGHVVTAGGRAPEAALRTKYRI